MFQKNLLSLINDDYVPFGEDYRFAYEKLAELMEEYCGEPPYSCRAAVLDVSLDLGDETCRRRVTVPMDISFFELHLILQQLFEWEDYHLHRFVLKAARNGDVLEVASMSPDEEEAFMFSNVKVFDENSIILSEIFPQRKRIFYEYDFGDGWIHEIRLVEIVESYTLPLPRCNEVEGLAPPEDCGGIGGFLRLREILENPKDPEYGDMLEWYGCKEIRNKNIEYINFLLMHISRMDTQ